MPCFVWWPQQPFQPRPNITVCGKFLELCCPLASFLSLVTISSWYTSNYFSLCHCRCYNANEGANGGSWSILTFASILYLSLQVFLSHLVLYLHIPPLVWKWDLLKAAHQHHLGHRNNTSASQWHMDFQRHLLDTFSKANHIPIGLTTLNTFVIKSRQNKTKMYWKIWRNIQVNPNAQESKRRNHKVDLTREAAQNNEGFGFCSQLNRSWNSGSVSY